MKRLEDMNLVDDFLAYSLTVHKTYGEEASRYMLECILQRKIRHLVIVPQKIWYGETPKWARTIFFYTKGIKENPSEELQQLARYMEHSTVENAQSAELIRLHEMVMEVKTDREVGLAYMKAFEIEKRIMEEGRAEGRAEEIVKTGYEFGLSDEDILGRLRKKLDISRELAQKYLEKFGKQIEFSDCI